VLLPAQEHYGAAVQTNTPDSNTNAPHRLARSAMLTLARDNPNQDSEDRFWT
jgi:hypothetical protein